MQNDEFEWHDTKAALNWRNHRITFIQAMAVFLDTFAAERIDEREDYGEERINRIGHCGGLILVMTYTMRGHRKRIISARRAEPHEADFFSHKAPVPDSDDDIPWADRDSPPYSAEEFSRMSIVPRVKTLRSALRLTQEEFAERYQIPIGTLRDWEQSRAEPDATARAYLNVIAGDPEGVVRALARVPKRPPAA